jgi:putative ABC transport system ATP-binding protein
MSGVTVKELSVVFTRGDYVVKPLDDFSAEAGDGELVMVLGPSGSGKTTLLSCLAAILTPSAGSVVVDGVDVTRLAGSAVVAYRQKTVGIVFQAFNLLPAFTATENVMAPLRVAGIGRREARRRATDLLQVVGLGDRGEHHPAHLSGGQQQRVAIARALVHDPPVIIADEPTAHLDFMQVEGVARLLRSAAAPGRVVIVSTHDERLLPLADRVIRVGPQRPLAITAPEGVRLEPGELLFSEGQPADCIWVVEEGSVELFRRRADGTEDRLRLCGPGEYFGEMGALLGIPRTASARAATETLVKAYPVNAFKEIIKNRSGPGLRSDPNL